MVIIVNARKLGYRRHHWKMVSDGSGRYPSLVNQNKDIKAMIVTRDEVGEDRPPGYAIAYGHKYPVGIHDK